MAYNTHALMTGACNHTPQFSGELGIISGAAGGRGVFFHYFQERFSCILEGSKRFKGVPKVFRKNPAEFMGGRIVSGA